MRKITFASAALLAMLLSCWPAMADSVGRISYFRIGGNSGCVYVRVADDPIIYSIQKDAINYPAMYSFLLAHSGGGIVTLADGGPSSCPLTSEVLSGAEVGSQTP